MKYQFTSTVVNPSPDEDPNTSTHNVASQPETSKRRRRWIRRTRYGSLARKGKGQPTITNIVVNLSSHQLSHDEEAMLSKNLKLCRLLVMLIPYNSVLISLNLLDDYG